MLQYQVLSRQRKRLSSFGSIVKNIVRIFNINEGVVFVTYNFDGRYNVIVQLYTLISSYNVEQQGDIKFCLNVLSVE